MNFRAETHLYSSISGNSTDRSKAMAALKESQKTIEDLKQKMQEMEGLSGKVQTTCLCTFFCSVMISCVAIVDSFKSMKNSIRAATANVANVGGSKENPESKKRQ